MAFVDLENNKIYGCKEGSLTWWHEKGHIIYNNSEKGAKNDFSRQSMKTLTIICSVLAHFHWIFLALAVFYLIAWIYYAVYEEVWCWIYAFKKKKQVDDSNAHKC